MLNYCKENLGDKPNGYFEHPEECGSFVACLRLFDSYIYYLFLCPDALYYKASSHECVYAEDLPKDSKCLQRKDEITVTTASPIEVDPVVCWKSKDSQFGIVKITSSGYLTSVRMEHVKGKVGCNDDPRCSSFWGCTKAFVLEGRIGTVITDSDDNLIYPKKESVDQFGFYLLEGYHENSQVLDMKFDGQGREVQKGQELKIWYSEDYFNSFEDDNIGEHCAKVTLNITIQR